MLRCILLLIISLLALPVFAQNADDAAFQQLMKVYEKRLRAVKTREEGTKILNEMMAKQQAYLHKKTDTVSQIKARFGVDQAAAAAQALPAGGTRVNYANNPLYTKCKVLVSFTKQKSDNASNSAERTQSQSQYSGNGKVAATMYLFKYMGRTMLAAGEDGMIDRTVSGSVSSSGSDQSPNTHSNYSSNGTALRSPVPIVSFVYEGNAHWSASITMNYAGSRMDGRGTEVDSASDGYDAAPENAKLTLSGNGFTVTRSIHESHNESHGTRKESSEESGTFSITITPEKSEKYIAYFEPVGGQQAYEQWMPEGYAEQPAQHGNFIDMKIKVESPSKPGVDFSNQIRYIRWELPTDEVSRVIGYADNAPTYDHFSFNQGAEKDHRSKLADMQLKLATDQADTTVEVLKVISSVANEYTVRVYAFDYGAFAKLVAHVFLTDSTEILATERGTGTAFLLLPKRDKDSKVATWFKKKNKVLDKKDADDDERMPGSDKYPGDGFTLYEEYRGFMENGKHFRGDPNAKDVMIYNTINTDRSRDGIATYEFVLNNYTGHVVKTHHRFRKEEFGRTRNDWTATEKDAGNEYGVLPIDPDKCLNFNFIPELHVVDQHGIAILKTTKKLGFAVASINVDSPCGPPKDFDFLVVSADFPDDSTGWSRTRADVDSNGNITVNPNGASLIITDEYARTLAHEMLHNTGINHHGDNGEYNQTGPSTFEYIGHSLWRLDGVKAVKVFWETAPGVPIDTFDHRFVSYLKRRGRKLTINIWHGTSSGFEDCIMRYDNPDGYAKTTASTEIYIVPPKTTYQELSGTHLCTSAKGTGVNDQHHAPMSRFGDASAGRGNCISQFCVNDRFAH